MNNSALNIHGVSGDTFSISYGKGSAATSVVVISASAPDSISVVLVISFAVELIVSDGTIVVGVGVVASVALTVEESVLVFLSMTSWTYSAQSSWVPVRDLSNQYNLNASDFLKRFNSDCNRFLSSVSWRLLIIEVYRLTA